MTPYLRQRKVKSINKHPECLESILANGLTGTLFLGLSFVFLFNSPLHPWIRGESTTDSSVFRTVAMMMRYGYMPYRDSFDHKGPLLYIIEFVGDALAGIGGIWIIELVLIFVTLVLMYRITSLWKIRRIPGIVCVLTSFSLLFTYFDGGNLVEEYAMPFIATALLIFVEYIKNDRISRKRLFICGTCLGCVCLLRINMIAVWIVFCIAIFIKSIVQKQYDELKVYITWFVLGFVVVNVPILIWLKANGALRSFWNAYITFNLKYASAEGGRALFPAKWKAFFTFSNMLPHTLSIISACYLFHQKTKERFLYGTYLICVFANLYLISASGMAYPHYGMVMIPLEVIPLAGFLAFINNGRDSSGKLISVVLMGFLLCYVIIGDWETVLMDAADIYYDRENRHLSETTKQLCRLVEEWTDEHETISVYGNYDIIYAETGRPHATRYSYQFPIGDVEPYISKQYWKQMKAEIPQIIVTESDVNNVKLRKYLKNNNYYLLWQSYTANLPVSYRLYCRADFLKDKEGKLLDLTESDKMTLSDASIVSDQYDGTSGILCQGTMSRAYPGTETIEESILKGDYVGLKYTIDDISEEEVLTFFGKKIAKNGQPGVYIFDEEGNVLRVCTDDYHNIDSEWKLYMINVKDLEGRVTIVFNGGYIDNTGSPDSQYLFSNIRFY